MNAGTWAADSYGRGDNGMMFGNHFGMMSGGFDGFGPMSLLTISVLSMFFFLAVLWWFIAILIINTFGVLELAYLIFFAKVWNLGGKKKEMAQGTQATPAHDHMSSPTHAHAENHSQTHESKEGMEQK
jgi:hypothetical protein